MLGFGELKVISDQNKHIFEVPVYLGSLDPNMVRVELYAEGVNGGAPVRQEMIPDAQCVEISDTTYQAQVPATRPAADYTARIIPRGDGVAVPLEAALILWQH